mgnify:CR=1 FL=1
MLIKKLLNKYLQGDNKYLTVKRQWYELYSITYTNFRRYVHDYPYAESYIKKYDRKRNKYYWYYVIYSIKRKLK